VYETGYLLFEMQQAKYTDLDIKKENIYDTYNYSDDYYKQKNRDTIKVKEKYIRILMQTKNDKMTTSFGGITSHLVTQIRFCRGYNISFGIIGHLIKLGDDLYQIKPYAVWR